MFPTSNDLTLIEKASYNLGIVTQVVNNSKLHHGLYWRLCIYNAAHQSALDNYKVDESRFNALLNGIPLNARHLKKDEGSLQNALVRFEYLSCPYIPMHEKEEGKKHLSNYATETLEERDQIIDKFKLQNPTLLEISQYIWKMMILGDGSFLPEQKSIRAAVPYILFKNKTPYPPLPISGARSFANKELQTYELWVREWLIAIHKELDQALYVNRKLQYGWMSARRQINGIRKSDTIFLAIDAIALCGLISAARLGRLIGVTTKRASQVLEELCELKAICEVTRRRTHKLYGFAEFDGILDHSAGPRKGRARTIPYTAPHDVSDFQCHMTLDKITELHEDAVKSQPAKPLDFNHFYDELDNANKRAMAVLKAFSGK